MDDHAPRGAEAAAIPQEPCFFRSGPSPAPSSCSGSGLDFSSGSGSRGHGTAGRAKGPQKKRRKWAGAARRRGTPTHPPARRSPASPLRFAPALLLTPRSLLSPLPAPCWHLAPRRRPPARPLRPGPRGGGSGGPVGGLEQSRLGAQLQLGAAEPLERDEGPRGAPPAALLPPCSATAPASLLLLLLQRCRLGAPPLPPHPCSPPRAHPLAAPSRPPTASATSTGAVKKNSVEYARSNNCTPSSLNPFVSCGDIGSWRSERRGRWTRSRRARAEGGRSPRARVVLEHAVLNIVRRAERE